MVRLFSSRLLPGPVEPGAYHRAITVPEDRFAEAKAWLQERVSVLERDGGNEFALGTPWNSQSVYFACSPTLRSITGSVVNTSRNQTRPARQDRTLAGIEGLRLLPEAFNCAFPAP